MRIWAIANQKGGVGKTTTSLALGRGLATLGHRVLLIDLDPHSSLTRAFGVPLDPPPQGVLELFGAPPAELSSLSRHSDIPGLDYVCAQAALATLERRSANQPGSAWPCRTPLPATRASTTTSCWTARPRWAC